jgi:hypothetical protein
LTAGRELLFAFELVVYFGARFVFMAAGTISFGRLEAFLGLLGRSDVRVVRAMVVRRGARACLRNDGSAEHERAAREDAESQPLDVLEQGGSFRSICQAMATVAAQDVLTMKLAAAVRGLRLIVSQPVQVEQRRGRKAGCLSTPPPERRVTRDDERPPPASQLAT